MCDCDNPPRVFEHYEVKGRKEYHCCECLGDIAKGARHVLSKGLWGGRWSTFRQCLDCAELTNEVSRATGCCIPFGYLMDYLDELDGERDRLWLERRDANYWRRKHEREAAKV